MEPVAAHAPVVPFPRYGVRRCFGGNRCVERGVEDGDVRDVRQHALCFFDRTQRRRVVEGRQRLELLDLFPNGLVNQDGIAKAGTAVHDAVRDGFDMSRDLIPGRHALGLVSVDDVQLQARRARVDD
jgi:hypothetical protein